MNLQQRSEDKKMVIFGAGEGGKFLLNKLGADRVYGFCDNYRAGQLVCEKPVLSFCELKRMHKEVDVIISVADFYSMIDIGLQLREAGISYKHRNVLERCVHVHGIYPNIHYDFNPGTYVGFRLTEGTIPMLKHMFFQYGERIQDANVDFWVFILDDPIEAEMLRRFLGVETIFAYSTVTPLRNKVIPIPDFNFFRGMADSLVLDYEVSFEAIRMMREKPYIYNQAFWAGTVDNSMDRFLLTEIADQYSDKVAVNPIIRDSKFNHISGKRIDMLRYMDYKYQIDARGTGWSGRVKFLLAMNRPLLLIDRPYEEYFFKDMREMFHYVPVKEGLSDLIEKIDFLDNNPDTARKISENAMKFAETHFSKQKILKDMFEQIMNNGGIKKNSGEAAVSSG